MDLSAHPCFDNAARLKYSRVHLPVAPACNVQCNFCDRRFDCANESRPGVTSALLTPTQAASYVDDVVTKDPSIRVVGIAGPGDPLAQATKTLETLRRVRENHPDMLLCVATNGLMLAANAEALAELHVSHVTVTLSAVDPEVGGRIYAWVRDGQERLTGREAGERILSAQRAGIEALVQRGVMVKINSIVVPGVNDHHILEVARVAAQLGATRFNCLPMRPVEGTPFGTLEEPSRDDLHRLRQACSAYLPQMEHCSRCRADAVGRIGHIPSKEQIVLLRKHSESRPEVRPYVAVSSHEGVLVNEHLGEAEQFWIFARAGDGFRLVERRPAPPEGSGAVRWNQLARVLNDCRSLLVNAAGGAPRRTLEAAGLAVHQTEGLIEDALDAVYQNRALPKPRTDSFRCGKGDSCRGSGLGCG
ncbi:MAG: radical SAM protein [Myxococcales bacterium]